MDNNNNHVIWVEKYRPSTVDECILPKATKKIATKFVATGSFPNLLLSGSAGTGKTTLAKALCNELGYDWILINGSNEGRLFDTLRNRIQNFASSVSFTGERKAVILDEFDHTPQDTVQAAMRSFMEEFAGNCSFIMTCNFPNRILEPIISRTSVIDFGIPPEEKSQIAMQIFHSTEVILNAEGIGYDKGVIAEIIKKYFPDFRRIINELQRYSVVGKIDTGILSSDSESRVSELVALLSDRNWKGMRNWVASNTSLDIGILTRHIYDNLYDIIETESIPEVILILRDGQYKNAFVADKEINIVAMITEIMSVAVFKK